MLLICCLIFSVINTNLWLLINPTACNSMDTRHFSFFDKADINSSYFIQFTKNIARKLTIKDNMSLVSCTYHSDHFNPVVILINAILNIYGIMASILLVEDHSNRCNISGIQKLYCPKFYRFMCSQKCRLFILLSRVSALWKHCLGF